MRLRYIGLLAGVFVVAWWASVDFGAQVDNYSYDEMFRRYQPPAWTPESVVLAIDEETLDATPGGMTNIRGALARALRVVDAASPRAVVVDLILTDQRDGAVDRQLADAFRATPNLVLSSMMLPDRWERVNPAFAGAAAAIGHVSAEPDEHDSVTRVIPLDKHIGHEQRWAIALEAFRLTHGGLIIESPEDLRVGSTVIPFRRTPDNGRLMRIRYAPSGIPTVSMKAVLENRSRPRDFAGKVVFVGVTAGSEVRDRLYTPYARGYTTTGIEIHANAFETMAQGLFITDSPESWVLLFSLVVAAGIGLAFAWLPGWRAYAAAVMLLVAAWFTPYFFFTHRIVFSWAASAGPVTACAIAAAAWQHLVVRRSLVRAEIDRARYQQAMHFVTHEMRTPLSAIQGSSELISRYSLTEQKRKQIADLINSESKRLARMIEVFLNVERLSAGQMQLKHEDIPIKQLVDTCLERTRPLADRKHIRVTLEPIGDDLRVTGDRELMEYACYNLLTNAVKYSPQNTEVTVSGWRADDRIRVAVRDQGIGMDQKEIKKIFQKFYRTKRAEESGEAGTGIGLSIVQQIVEQHGGAIEVVSKPGAGSCFTLVIPAVVDRALGAARPTTAQQH
ncbi:MAG TPA: CHASE2 domain-containing protein [Bryobacteraceae bacterium]|nr:CHASE2 domain-containing protein [Bryobacteraceae bacterium]